VTRSGPTSSRPEPFSCRSMHPGWLRIAVCHKPSRPLRTNRPAAREPAGHRRVAGGHDQQPRAPLSRRGQLRRCTTAYDWVAAYGRSTLANLLFTYELQRRLTEKGSAMMAVAAILKTREPSCSATRPAGSASGRSYWRPYYPKARRWVPCRRCGRPLTQMCLEASTTDQPALPSSAAIRRRYVHRRSHMTKSCSSECGRYQRTRPA
jgi:hypothetical protein